MHTPTPTKSAAIAVGILNDVVAKSVGLTEAIDGLDLHIKRAGGWNRWATIERFLADAMGYIAFECGVPHHPYDDKAVKRLAETLAHDIAGLYHRDEGFLPRVSGYVKYNTHEA